ncbi:MAG: type II toxin-antitoxin system VapC family toxin [Chlorobium sp.]
MLIYLDICCFNRPFDDQSDLLVRLQTEAKLYVQEMIRSGSLSLIWSAVMDMENAANPDINRKVAVGDWQKIGLVDVPVSRRVENIALKLALIGIKPMDALHVACAIEAEAEYFLTTDKALLRTMAKHDHLRVVDPVEFIRALKETQYED